MYAAELRPRAKPGYVHSLSCDPVKFSQDLGRANLTLAFTQNRRLLASRPTSELPELYQVTITVNRFEISFSGSILHHTYGMIYRVLLINVSKTGNTNSFSKTQFMVHRTE